MFKSENNSRCLNSAFTLVELAIVIVVLGIVVSGVVAGQSIIRTANTNSTVTEIQKMQTAIRAFQLEFDATPGLMKDAYDYFGDECGNNSKSSENGCNGDAGNDRCIDSGYNCSVIFLNYRDVRRLPIHLVLSEIYPGLKYTTNANTITDCNEQINTGALDTNFLVGSEIPGKIFLYYFQTSGLTHNGSYCTGTIIEQVISPRIVKSIDDKLDDGNGRRGIIRAIYRPRNNIYSGTDCMDADGVYNVAADDPACGLRAELQ
jgi:prepilin-type N-terminal cleavage/methylation domain-containing protein